VTEDPAKVLAELFERMVTRHEGKHPPVRRTDEEVWQQPFEVALQGCDGKVLASLQESELSVGSFCHRFEHAWQPESGPLHLLVPLSFDLVEPSDIVDKAVTWRGRVRLLRTATLKFKVFMLLGRPSVETHEQAYFEAKAVLESEGDSDQRVVPEDEASQFAADFARAVISFN
jgi:hypothetical protein